MVIDQRAGVEGADRTDRVFHALADATRRDIFACVLRGEQSVSALARRYPMSFAAVHKHVAVLEHAELVSKRRRGREQLVRGEIEALRPATALFDQLEAIWRARLDRFGEILAAGPDSGDIVAAGPAGVTDDRHQG